MRIAYVDCTGGVAGELILGALLDLGVTPARLRATLSALAPAAYELVVEPVRLPTGPATSVALSVVSAAPPATLLDRAAGLPPGVAEPTSSALRRLFGAATAATGELDPEQATRDAGLVACAMDGLAALGVERVHASAVNVRGVAESPPAAALELLRGATIAVEPCPAPVTPAGAAIAAEVVSAYGFLPPIRLDRVGTGAGRAVGGPVLRMLVGETAGAPVETEADWVTVVECNLDDLNPQIYEHVFALLFAAGALDVSATPIVMKKGRPGTLLAVISRPERAQELAGIVLRETTTLGVRFQEMPRRLLRRTATAVETPYGPIGVKIAWADGTPLKAAPEYEECRRAAVEHGVPLQQVMDAAKAAWSRR